MDNDPSVSEQPQPAPTPWYQSKSPSPAPVEEEEFVSQPAKLMRIASMASSSSRRSVWPRSTTPAGRG